jgi:demethylmenaquinone methyltransferase/2-methoxy-6-polyprenyl-1,4-benzoquinol methylase
MEKDNFFNIRAEHWDETAKHDMTKVDLLLRLLAIKKDDQVLDVGTGTGVLLPLLATYTAACNITAIDSAEKMIAVAQRKYASMGCSFIVGDAIVHPFPPEYYDAIVCYSVFPHFEDKPGVIRHLAAALKKGGLLAVLHSSCKEKINTVHVHAHDVAMDSLPPADVLAELMRKFDLKPEIVIDNSELYAVYARKRYQGK